MIFNPTLLVVTEQFAFEAVAVVPTSHSGGLKGLRQGGYCHPGMDYFEQRWSPRVSKTLEREIVGMEPCSESDTRHNTLEELETFILSNFFGAACRQGRWSLDDAIDARLKSEYPNLCTLCSANGTSDCSSGYRYDIWPRFSNTHLLALKCLTENNGSVAYVAWEYVTQYFLRAENDQFLLCGQELLNCCPATVALV
ncbi:Transferrin [Eumeta japonica]|uniref:Transferrin n=1 Tax=Eumeta variegata TaxID=151549 RepID=A0A4C1YI02_EUMVA|nr:Transferrin [Eumeta japonica]